MKRFFALLTVGTMLFSIAACGGSTETEQTTAAPLPSVSAEEPPVTTTAATTTTTTAEEPPATTTTPAEAAEEADLSALELLGYQIGEEGEIFVDEDQWQECEDFDLFRKYFFGTWENAEEKGINSLFVIDDSEKATLSGHWHFGGFYKIGENALLFKVSGQVQATLFWLDIGDPDRMYREYAEGYARNQLVFREFQRENDHKTPVLIKTDLPPNEPEENFLSIYKLLELSRDRGIDLDLLVNIEYKAWQNDEEKGITNRYFVHDDWYQFYPVYLVSEAPDRLEFKTQVGNLLFENSEIDVRYTLEKIGGEWVRTVEYDDELLSAVEMIGYRVEDGSIYLDTDSWRELEEYDLLREYFFGTWENAEGVMGRPLFIVDDSEKSSCWRFGGLYEAGESILVYMMGWTVEQKVFWLDKNEPERMYGECLEAYERLYKFRWRNHRTAVLTKTDAPPNEPENNFLSDVRLRELSRDHGIDLHEMIYIHCETDREKDGKKTTVYLDAEYYDKYLVSESPEKVVLKTLVGSPYEDLEIDAWCTFEKINGEWVRTVEFDGDVRLQEY